MGSIAPAIMLKMVVFPAPLGPISALIWPGLDGEVHAPNGREPAEFLGEPLDFEQAPALTPASGRAPPGPPGRKIMKSMRIEPEDDDLVLAPARVRGRQERQQARSALGQQHDGRRAQHAAPEARRAAQHHHDHQLDGEGEAERRGIDEGQVVGVERPGERRRGAPAAAKTPSLSLAVVDARGFCGGRLAAVQRPERAPDARVDDVARPGRARPRRQPHASQSMRASVSKRKAPERQRRDAGEPRGPAGDAAPVHEHVVDDDAEAEGGHGQEQPREPEDGQPDEESRAAPASTAAAMESQPFQP